MANPRTLLSCTFMFLVILQSKVLCYQHKVGDLSAWVFLYPPTQDSVIQVTPDSYKSCNLKDPILYMNNGNSLFNITMGGEFYFISGEPGHCIKGQKLHISLVGNGSTMAYAPSSSLPDTAAGPSYANAFGSIPTASSSSSLVIGFSICVMFVIWALFL
ncbi:hypothetical protein V2J09_004873 [Rumex salicifolius]